MLGTVLHETTMSRPNILFIWTDQQRWDTLGVLNPLIKTPHLDALASRGVVYSQTYCNSPLCMPSRASALSGRMPTHTGSTHNGIEYPYDPATGEPRVPHIGSMLREAGYHTANLGKLHFLNHAHRDHRQPHPSFGFSEVRISDEPGCYEDAYIQWVRQQDPDAVDLCRCSTPPAYDHGPPLKLEPRDVPHPYIFRGPEHLTHTAFVASITRDFIHDHADDDQPWLAIAGIYAPHCPINPPARFVDGYDPAEMPLPHRNPGENHGNVTDEQWRIIKQHYYALVSHVDDQVGRILAALDETGQRDNTLVIFTSDHGEYLGDHGRINKGPPGHDACARVPLIVCPPGGCAGRVDDELVELLDLVPTMLDYADVEKPDELCGRSLRPHVERTGAFASREAVLMELLDPPADGWRTMITRDAKYGLHTHGDRWIIDRTADPHELTDLANGEVDPALLHRLNAQYVELMLRLTPPARDRTGRY